jgi:hypothetical protein
MKEFMQQPSIQRTEAAATAAIVLKVVKEQEPTPVAEPFRLHVVANKGTFITSTNSYRPARRYTIDDNGGSYEGL